jgi:leucyl/phenylalanyl-tRNA--protein transferase
MIPWLGSALTFPPACRALADPDGLLAAGGDLSPARLLAAYAEGIFPWYAEGQPILWWAPSERMVFFPEKLHISRSLAKAMRKRRYRVTTDLAFRQVIEACAEPRGDSDGSGSNGGGSSGTWIVAPMIEAYCRLHELGHAHSFELWMDGELAGGMYGVALGCMFYGESMFSRRRDGSKIALAHAVQHLGVNGFELFDCQMYTAHLASLGAQLVPRAQFIARLKQAVEKPQPLSLWEYDYSNEPA